MEIFKDNTSINQMGCFSMFHELTRSHCLYNISQQSFDEFLQLANKHTFAENIAVPLSLNSVDNCGVVLQIWCMLNEDEHKLVFDVDKMMAYGCNYYCLNLLKTDNHIKTFISCRQRTPHLLYVLSYYLAYATSCWVYELMQEDERGPELIHINMTRNYFLFAEEEQLILNPEHHFYATQRYITQLLALDLKNSERYNDYIQTALQNTKKYLNSMATIS